MGMILPYFLLTTSSLRLNAPRICVRSEECLSLGGSSFARGHVSEVKEYVHGLKYRQSISKRQFKSLRSSKNDDLDFTCMDAVTLDPNRGLQNSRHPSEGGLWQQKPPNSDPS